MTVSEIRDDHGQFSFEVVYAPSNFGSFHRRFMQLLQGPFGKASTLNIGPAKVIDMRDGRARIS